MIKKDFKLRKNQQKIVEHYFNLPVVIDGKEIEFQGRLVTFGYAFKFYIIVEGRELAFEKDDDGNYRVVSEGIQPDTIKKDIFEAIITALKTIEKM